MIVCSLPVHAQKRQIILSAFLVMLTSCNKPPTKLFNVYTKDDESQNQEAAAPEKEEPKASEPISDEETKPWEEPKTDSGTPVVTPPIVVTPPVVTPMPEPETSTVPLIEECANKLSVGRIYQWIATSEGQMVPSSGTIVVKENGKNVAKVKFIGNEWHVLPTWLKNSYEAEVDLSASKGFTLTYSATADLYLQLRPSFAWSGGDKYLVKIPSTAGVSKSLTVDFKEASWTTLDSLGKPAYPLAMAVKQARGFVFVGNVPNDFAVTGLAIDRYSPPCP